MRRRATSRARSRSAASHGYRLAVRAGGHSYAGYSSGTGRLVVDVTSMAGVVPAATPGATARVGAGARLIDVYNTLGHAGQLVPGGSCPTVGVAGLTLGGGVGVFARRYGLAADNVTALTVVTADGVARTCSASQDQALYWACRGGGGGNFGVVTSFQFTTHPMPDVTLFTYDFDWDAAHDVLGAWQHWTRAVNPAVWSNCQLLSGAGTSSVRVAGVSCASTAQTAAWLAPLLAQVHPTYSFVGPEAYQRAMMIEAGCSGLTVAACHLDTHPPGVLSRQAFVASSSYVAAPMRDARLAAVVSVVNDLAAELPALGGGLVFDALGGRVNAGPGDRDGVRAPRLPLLDPVVLQLVDGDPVLADPGGLDLARTRAERRLRPGDRRLPELHRPHTVRVAARLLRREPSAAHVRQARRRPRPRLQLRPVDPAGALSTERRCARLVTRAGGARGPQPRRRLGGRGPRGARAPRDDAPRRRCRRI